MQAGPRRPHPEPPDPLASAAASVRTLEELAGLLRDLRRRHARSRRDSRLTYRELAARTGWSQTAIAEYFTARTLPPTDRFDALLELLNASPNERRALATARDRIEEAGRHARGRRARGPKPPSPSPAPPPALSPSPPPPRQLPAAPRMFTGRMRELTYLDAALDEQSRPGGTVVISAIGGMGGIGKTWLSLHWAYRNLDRFPDGQLYVNLRGFDPADQPLAPAAVVRGFLEALGVPSAAIPVEHDPQAALYRSLAAGKRMLILLDNARDTAQVAPLLPGGVTCTVLLTNRRRLTGLIASHGARSVALDGLPEPEARELLTRHLGRERLEAEPEAARTLLTCCAGLPLALSVVAARATTNPHLSLAALAADLADTADRLDALDAGEPQADLRAVLSWSSRALSAEAARALGLLGIAPGPNIGLSAAARLLDQPAAATRAVLRELGDAHLIQQFAPDCYRMHDLLRLHATELASDHHAPADRQAALRRLVDFYAHAACGAARRLEPDRPAHPLVGSLPGSAPPAPPDAASAMAWFDATHANLLAAQQLAGTHDWHAQVFALARALDPYHRSRGHFEDQAASWRRAVTCAERLPDREAGIRAEAHQMLGDAYAQLERTTEALHHLGLALTLAENAGNVAAQGEIQHSLGGTWERHGDDRRALDHAKHALLIFRRLGDLFQQARALNAVGWLQSRLGEHTDARANCQAALTLLRKIGNRHLGESHVLDSLGYIAHHLHEHDQALDYYHQALALCRGHGYRFLEADVLDHIAQSLLARNEPDRARDTWRQAHELFAAQHRIADAQLVRRRIDELG